MEYYSAIKRSTLNRSSNFMHLKGSMLSERSQFPKLHAVWHSGKDKSVRTENRPVAPAAGSGERVWQQKDSGEPLSSSLLGRWDCSQS